MKLSDWAKNKVSYPTALRWFKEGKLPVKAYKTPSGTILVDEETSNQNSNDVSTNIFLLILDNLPNSLYDVAAKDIKVKNSILDLAKLIAESPAYTTIFSIPPISLEKQETDPYELIKEKLFEEVLDVLDSKLSALFINYLGDLSDNTKETNNEYSFMKYKQKIDNNKLCWRPEKGRKITELENNKSTEENVETLNNNSLNENEYILAAIKLNDAILSGEASPSDFDTLIEMGVNKEIIKCWKKNFADSHQPSTAKPNQVSKDILLKELGDVFLNFSSCTTPQMKAQKAMSELQEAAKCLENMIYEDHLIQQVEKVETVNINGYEIPKDPDELRNIPLTKEAIKNLDVAKKVLDNHVAFIETMIKTKSENITKQFQSKDKISITGEFVRAKLAPSELIDTFIQTLATKYSKNTNLITERSVNLLEKELTKVSGQKVSINNNAIELFCSFMEETDPNTKGIKHQAFKEFITPYFRVDADVDKNATSEIEKNKQK